MNNLDKTTPNCAIINDKIRVAVDNELVIDAFISKNPDDTVNTARITANIPDCTTVNMCKMLSVMFDRLAKDLEISEIMEGDDE